MRLFVFGMMVGLLSQYNGTVDANANDYQHSVIKEKSDVHKFYERDADSFCDSGNNQSRFVSNFTTTPNFHIGISPIYSSFRVDDFTFHHPSGKASAVSKVVGDYLLMDNMAKDYISGGFSVKIGADNVFGNLPLDFSIGYSLMGSGKFTGKVTYTGSKVYTEEAFIDVSTLMPELSWTVAKSQYTNINVAFSAGLAMLDIHGKEYEGTKAPVAFPHSYYDQMAWSIQAAVEMGQQNAASCKMGFGLRYTNFGDMKFYDQKDLSSSSLKTFELKDLHSFTGEFNVTFPL